MSIQDMMTTCVGKAVRAAARLRGGGSAFPGKVVERIDPGYLARELGQLPLGVVLVSGTNGKTTTTRMVASMLSDLGLRVFTNPTGSNFVRGVVSAVLGAASPTGRLDADIAVLELDEAYAVHFVRQVRPRYALLLNVMRDQLDRFGEIDTTARLLSHVAEATTGTVVLNREDPRIAALAAKVRADIGARVRYFGLTSDLRRFFPSDDDMATTVSVEEAASSASSASAHDDSPVAPSTDARPAAASVVASAHDGGSAAAVVSAEIAHDDVAPAASDGVSSAHDDSLTASSAPASAAARSTVSQGLSARMTDDELRVDVALTAVGDHQATFLMRDDPGEQLLASPDLPQADDSAHAHTTAVKLEGVYNLYNAAAALAVVRAVQQDAIDYGFVRYERCGGSGENRGPDPRARHFAGLQSAVRTDESLAKRIRQFGESSPRDLIAAVSQVTPAFGRGEVIDVDGSPVELLLVKNPMGFRLSLASFDPADADTMIVINDEYADGRDMSWLWDVDFTSLRASGVRMVSGVRAWDMALRLAYDQVPVAATDTDIEAALAAFVKANPGRPKHIYCTYTSMLRVRAALARVAHVADAGVGK